MCLKRSARTLSNSSIKQTPLSANTNAPASSVHSLVTGCLWTYAVNPTADAPWPVVNTALWAAFSTYFRNWDLAVPGSPHRRMLMSPRSLCFPPWQKIYTLHGFKEICKYWHKNLWMLWYNLKGTLAPGSGWCLRENCHQSQRRGCLSVVCFKSGSRNLFVLAKLTYEFSWI